MATNNDRALIGACPARDELIAFSLGQLSDSRLATVADHLQACAGCTAALDAVREHVDPVLAGLRQPLPADPLSAAEARRVHALADRVVSRLTFPPAPAKPPPAHLGQYQLLEPLGSGGMGEVFKARHQLMDRLVALKIIHHQRLGDPAAVQRFHSEIRALAQLDHPNIVRALDAGLADGQHFLVMEYVEGTDLARLLRRDGPLPVAQACAYAQQAAAGLQHAHEHGLVHRDVKPSNLIITLTGQVKVLDLGLALFREGQPGPGGAAPPDYFLGTADYMAPEQRRDTHAVDGRADVYSLGCTLYHLLAGQSLFRNGVASLSPERSGHAVVPVPSVRDLRPDVPAKLDAVLGRMLAEDPARRYASAAEVGVALQPFAAPAGGDGQKVPPEVTRRRLQAGQAGLALVLLLNAVAWGLLPLAGVLESRRPAPPLARPETFRVAFYPGKHGIYKGDLGLSVFETYCNDNDTRVFVRLNEPAFSYLIAFKPDGQEQLCYPKAGPPPLTTDFAYPPDQTGKDEQAFFVLGNRPGLQAFVLLTSWRPLPAYADWRQRLDPAPWEATEADGVWEFDGQEIHLLPAERGDELARSFRPPKPFEKLCHFFKDQKDQAGINRIRALAFPVKAAPNARPAEPKR
jgi:serine/threonine protein kinase